MCNGNDEDEEEEDNYDFADLDEGLELLSDPDHEEPGDEALLGGGQGPVTARLPALGRHAAEKRNLKLYSN